MIISEDDYLAHYGILRKSGRYPWGSGGNVEKRSRTFIDVIANLRAQGLSDAEIARGFSTPEHPFTTTDLRALNSIARNERKRADIARATQLKAKGMSNVEIGKKMDLNESSVRSLLADSQKEKTDILNTISSMLREEVDKGGYIDIGTGVENHLGISKEKLGAAVSILKAEGYVVQRVQVDQLGTTNKTLVKVLGPPGTTYRDVVTQKELIRQVIQRSDNGGRSFSKTLPPISVDSKRVSVIYKEDGGAEADGVIYVRPGVPDLSLGNSRYAQVRIAVDGTHYLKGMAIYKDDLPNGVDLAFNTNKSNTGDKLDAMKPIKADPTNPFGAVFDQIGDRDAAGNLLRVTSAMNVVNEEGDWGKWKKSISSQVLSKQSPTLARTQLAMTYEQKKRELDEIMSLTNPTVRQKLLESYADDADASAVHLKAASLPRQAAQVILPVNTLKDNEIYAPNFRNGERVALIRYPHGGTFEIPELVVNNKHPDAKSLIGLAKDAVGINNNVASRLSGADFDGDTVLVIPNPASNPKLKTQAPLEGLKGFDPQRDYKLPEGQTFKGNKQMLMGQVSNLITDMTIRGANNSELAAAVRHSMVVIDAEKHNLDWKRSEIDNGISNLKKKYQGSANAGASTLISRATSRQDVPLRRPRPASKGGPIDKATGEKVYELREEASYVNSKGQTVFRTQRSTKLAETKDATTLIDGVGTPIERVYADHSNKLKALANQARKAAVNTTTIPYSPTAKKVYADEVKQLDAALNIALKNRPLERQAQLIANAQVQLKRQADPSMDRTQIKKVESIALEDARLRTGAGKQRIEISDRQWEAIQAGAITPNKLKTILDNSNLDRVKSLATPRVQLAMTSAKLARAKQMVASGYTQAEIADALGVGLTTLKEGLK